MDRLYNGDILQEWENMRSDMHRLFPYVSVHPSDTSKNAFTQKQAATHLQLKT